ITACGIVDFDDVAIADELTCLGGGRAVDADGAAQHGVTGSGAALREAALLEGEIEADALRHGSAADQPLDLGFGGGLVLAIGDGALELAVLVDEEDARRVVDKVVAVLVRLLRF